MDKIYKFIYYIYPKYIIIVYSAVGAMQNSARDTRKIFVFEQKLVLLYSKTKHRKIEH